MKRGQSQIQEQLVSDDVDLLDERSKEVASKHKMDKVLNLEKKYLPEIISTLKNRRKKEREERRRLKQNQVKSKVMAAEVSSEDSGDEKEEKEQPVKSKTVVPPKPVLRKKLKGSSSV